MSSPPQRALFIEYHHLYGRRPEFLGRFARGLGALGPSDEGQARGPRNALSTYGLPHAGPGHRRIVLEVDGIRHYSKERQTEPSCLCRNHPSRRDLRLSSYEVYRFGGYELSAASLAHCQ
jgi:hypothetical protein